MTIDDIIEQTKALSTEERKQLAKHLIDTLVSTSPPQSKTGAEIAAYLEQTPPVELVDSHIDDPTDWVKAQRRN